MTAKQRPTALQSPDGSYYVTLTDGAGNLAPASGGGSSNPNGQATMANSAPVVVSSDQSAIPVTLTSTTITGTVAATQSGTWTVQPGNTANTTAWKVDGSAVTQPISGAVTITSLVPGVAATSLGKAEDAAHSSGDTGVFSLGVANEAQTVLANDGDYIGMGHDTKGNTFVIGNVASAATDAGAPVKVGGKYNSAVQAFTNGQRADLQVDQRGGLLIQDGQAIPSVSVTSATTLFTVADTSGYGSISVQVTSAGSSCTITYEASEDGTTWISVNGYAPSTSTGAGVTTSTTATQTTFPLNARQFRARVSTYGSGTVTVQGTLRKDLLAPRSNIVSVSGTTTVAGTLAEGSALGSVNVGTVIEARTTNKTPVGNGLNIKAIATSIGAAVNKPFQIPELDWSYPAAAGGISNTTSAVTMVAAAGAGIRNYLTAIQVSAGALGAASEIAVRDGAGGTVIWRGFISTAGGNQSVNLSSPIKSTANTLLEVVTLTATITGAVYINAQGYQAP